MRARSLVLGLFLVWALLVPASTSAQRYDIVLDRYSMEQAYVSAEEPDGYSISILRDVARDGTANVSSQLDFYAYGVSAGCPIPANAFTMDWNKGTVHVVATLRAEDCWGAIGFGESLTVDLIWTPDGTYHSTGHTSALVYYGSNAPSMTQGKLDYWNANVSGHIAVDGETVQLPTEWGNTSVYRSVQNSKW